MPPVPEVEIDQKTRIPAANISMKICVCVFVSAILSLAVQPLAAVTPDVAGAQDLDGVPRFPRAWIVDYVDDPQVAPRELVLSAAEKYRSELRAERILRIDAPLRTVTYQMPAGTPTRDVVEHYQRLLGNTSVFQCQGRDCGRSNQWANQIFQKAVLYGPDANQFYLSSQVDLEDQARMLSVYVIQRGNRRTYAHVVELRLSEVVQFDPNMLLQQKLPGDGYLIVGGATPALDGTLDQAARDVLQTLRVPLQDFARDTVYVVCHLQGSSSADQLLERSDACARSAVEALTQDGGPTLVPFGAGPLLPRPQAPATRIELILPERRARN